MFNQFKNKNDFEPLSMCIIKLHIYTIEDICTYVMSMTKFYQKFNYGGSN